MSKKTVFVILWLTLAFPLLAQGPERTKPATQVSCWDCPTSVVGEVKQISPIAQKPVPSTSTPAPKETPQQEEEIRMLREKNKTLETEISRDRMIKLRAEQIDLTKKIKKEQDRLRKSKDEDSSVRKARKEVEKQEKAQQTWATSRSKAMLRGCGDKTWIHEKFAGPGYQFLERVNVTIYNNTGGEIREIKINDKGTIVEHLCAGGSLILHRHFEGQPYGINFSFIAEAQVYEGGVAKIYVWELPANLYRGSSSQQPLTWVLTKDNRRTY